MHMISINNNCTAALGTNGSAVKSIGSTALEAIGSAVEAVEGGAQRLCAAASCRIACAPAGEQGGGQSHILEIVVGILIVVVLGIFLYLTTVPEVKTLINDAMSTIGTIKPN